MSLTVLDLASLKSSLETWEIIEYAATGVVIIGVIGEYIADFTEFAEQRNLERPMGKLSCLILIVGLVLEMIGVVRTSQLSGQIVEDSQASVKELDTQLSNAQGRMRAAEAKAEQAAWNAGNTAARAATLVESFRLDIARANDSAAKATREAARITQANLALRAELLKLQTSLAERVVADNNLTLAFATVP
jgi:hypothetical protein